MIYEVRPRKDRRGVDLISDALPFGRLWYAELNAVSNALDYAKFRSRSPDAVIRVYDADDNMTETHLPPTRSLFCYSASAGAYALNFLLPLES